MAWHHIHAVNKRASARKAKRERKAAEMEAMHERLGGTVTVGELRTATREWRTCRGGYGPFEVEVWVMRGREWRVVTICNELGAVPHQEWRQDPTLSEWVPITHGGREWVRKMWEAEALKAEQQ